MVLQEDKYYVVVGSSLNKTRKERVLVQFKGRTRIAYLDKAEERYLFEIIAHLTECSEGAPEIGEIESVREEDLKTMNDDGFFFEEPTSTELVLYAKAR